MSNKVTVAARVIGGSLQEYQASSVQDVYNQMGLTGSYTATVNGDAADFSDSIESDSFLTFTKSVKGGK